MCVCFYVSVCVCFHVCVCVFLCLYVSVCVCVSMYVCFYVFSCVCFCVCVSMFLYVCARVHVCVCVPWSGGTNKVLFLGLKTWDVAALGPLGGDTHTHNRSIYEIFVKRSWQSWFLQSDNENSPCGAGRWSPGGRPSHRERSAERYLQEPEHLD